MSEKECMVSVCLGGFDLRDISSQDGQWHALEQCLVSKANSQVWQTALPLSSASPERLYSHVCSCSLYIYHVSEYLCTYMAVGGSTLEYILVVCVFIFNTHTHIYTVCVYIYKYMSVCMRNRCTVGR